MKNIYMSDSELYASEKKTPEELFEEFKEKFVNNVETYSWIKDDKFVNALRQDKDLEKAIGSDFDKKLMNIDVNVGLNHIETILNAVYKLLDEKITDASFKSSLEDYKKYMRAYLTEFVELKRKMNGVTNEGSRIIIFPSNFTSLDNGIQMEYLDKTLKEICDENNWSVNAVYICTKRVDNTICVFGMFIRYQCVKNTRLQI